MNGVIAPKESSLKPKHIEEHNVLKLSMSLIHNNPTNVAESLILNTLIPSRRDLPYDFDDSNDNENEEDDDDDDLSPMPVESEEDDYMC